MFLAFGAVSGGVAMERLGVTGAAFHAAFGAWLAALAALADVLPFAKRGATPEHSQRAKALCPSRVQ
jgi:hypothetical protein